MLPNIRSTQYSIAPGNKLAQFVPAPVLDCKTCRDIEVRRRDALDSSRTVIHFYFCCQFGCQEYSELGNSALLIWVPLSFEHSNLMPRSALRTKTYAKFRSPKTSEPLERRWFSARSIYRVFHKAHALVHCVWNQSANKRSSVGAITSSGSPTCSGPRI